MANALKNPPDERTCLEYFELEQSPFACLPDTSPLFRTDQNALLESRLAETLSDTDSLLVLRGADGVGKTTLLKRFLDDLGDATLHALIDETCTNGNAFYCSFLRQMGFEDISGKLKELRTIAREFLVHRVTAGDPVPLVLDNAPRIRPTVLEQLRWLAGIQHDGQRVLSVVITGNAELERVLDAPAMANLRSTETRIFHVRALTEDETDAYIEHRLELAGAKDKLNITPAARGAIHQFSGGLPGAIDRIGSLVMIEATNRETSRIDDTLVLDVAEAEELPINVIPMDTRGRRKTDTKAGKDKRSTKAARTEAKLAQRRIDKLEKALKKSEARVAELQESVAELEELRNELATRDSRINELTCELAAFEECDTQVRKQLSAVPEDDALDEPAGDAEVEPIVAFEVVHKRKIVEVFDVPPGSSRIMVGRDDDSDLVLQSEFVSRHHALLFCKPWETYVEDLKSFNGTLVNGESVSRHELKPGDHVLIGDFILRPLAEK